MKPVASEHQLHLAVAQFLRVAFPGLFWWTVDQTALHSRHGHTLKAKGVRAGVADICMVLPGGRAAFIELKAERGKQTASQIEFEADVKRSNGYYALCRNLAEVQGVLKAWGVK